MRSLGPSVGVLHLDSNLLQHFEDVCVDEDTLWDASIVESQQSKHGMRAESNITAESRNFKCTQREGSCSRSSALVGRPPDNVTVYMLDPDATKSTTGAAKTDFADNNRSTHSTTTLTPLDDGR